MTNIAVGQDECHAPAWFAGIFLLLDESHLLPPFRRRSDPANPVRHPLRRKEKSAFPGTARQARRLSCQLACPRLPSFGLPVWALRASSGLYEDSSPELSGRARITEVDALVEQAFQPVPAQPGKAVPPQQILSLILARRLTTMVMVKYASRKSFLTVRMQDLVELLFKEFGDNVSIQFVPMDPEEIDRCTNDGSAFRGLHTRFFVLDEANQRREDLENLIVYGKPYKPF